MPLLRIDQYAKLCKVSGEVIRRRIRSGKIRYASAGRSPIFVIDTNEYPVSKQGKKLPGRPKFSPNKR